MRKFIQGTFELDKNVENLKEYENVRMEKLKAIIDWADQMNVGVNFGTLDDNTYACEYYVDGNTLIYCKGLVAELKAMLKKDWKTISVLWQGNGDKI